MKIFEVNISRQVCVFLKDCLNDTASVDFANQKLVDICGINTFFDNYSDLQAVQQSVCLTEVDSVEEPNRAEYGDFQTNIKLAQNVVTHLVNENISPEIIIEPTCGQGNFILASLAHFKTIKKVFGIEIYKPYVWQTKFSILDYFISNPDSVKPEIKITHCSVFDFNFNKFSEQFHSEKILIIGNPPWVTNSKLGSLNSQNVPHKSNFKNNNGLDALTGKGNFDIAEYITLMLFDAFQSHDGYFAFLVKNSVIRTIVFDQKEKKYKIGHIEKHCIDSKKEFNVSVEASLFLCQLNLLPSFKCDEFNFYSIKKILSFGWLDSKFVSNIDDYNETKNIDGVCPFEWRQGIKHDCATIMELEKTNGHFINKLSEEFFLEDEMVFGFLKSSDLKNTVIKNTRKYTIVTQTKIGQETGYIQHLYPATYAYLKKNISFFKGRKSTIYNGKPEFSIFGIGEYSFKPYKVAISGLYKTYHFTLVLPQNNKPVMLDDTCYFIGFDNIEFAVYSIILLNYYKTKEFLKSITFSDAKRVFTKDLLMRIDLCNIAECISEKEIQEQLIYLNNKYELTVNLTQWNNYINKMKLVKNRQLTIFY